jgi:hypothetical protein
LPRTRPAVVIEATAVFDELHVPPAIESVNVVVAPLHTVDAPIIGGTDGAPLTVMLFVDEVLPHVFDTV